MLGPGSTRVGGLTVAVLRRVSGLRWGLSGHNLLTRQCLGHQVPVNAWAHCQSMLALAGTLLGGVLAPSLSLVTSRFPFYGGAPTIPGTCHPQSSFHIWDMGPLASLGNLPGQA